MKQADHEPVVHLEAGLQRLGHLVDQPLHGVPAPVDEVLPRSALAPWLLSPPTSARRLRDDALVLDHVLGGLADHTALLVEALATRTARDLLELAHAQDAELLSVELEQPREQHGADGDVHAHTQGVRPADDLEQAPLSQPLDQQSIPGEQAGVVDADPEGEKAPELFAVRGVEGEGGDLFLDVPALLARADLCAGQRLGLLGSLALGEVHHVDR